jgi:hypothetical protein
MMPRSTHMRVTQRRVRGRPMRVMLSEWVLRRHKVKRTTLQMEER